MDKIRPLIRQIDAHLEIATYSLHLSEMVMIQSRDQTLFVVPCQPR